MNLYFSTKRIDTLSDEEFEKCSELYSRMDMPAQPWTRGTEQEIDYILSNIDLKDGAKILDMGCGQGRHCLTLSRRGYNKVLGIDFSEPNIEKARHFAQEEQLPVTFLPADARKLSLGYKFDCILCLYDVIGSFRKEDDNIRIIRSLKRNLKKGGYAILSVMNMELTEAIAIHHASISKNPDTLLKLPPSDTMQASGNIFKPEYYMINTDDGLVYRKEQFTAGEDMFAEYLVADKRYRKDEITALVKAEGLRVIDCRYVQAGHWDVALSSTDAKAKEILLIIKNDN